MTHVLLDAPVRYWRCPSCLTTDKTQRSDVHTQFHPCAALGNANIPLVEVSDPDDAPVGRQIVVASEVDSGIASIRTERPDGSNDVTVFARPAEVTAVTTS